MLSMMLSLEGLFYLAGLVAIIASLKMVMGNNVVHALLYLVVSLLAVAVCFYLMGAPFAAGLEVIVYAGAILVLFVFAIMMFGLTKDETKYAPKSSGLKLWFGPIVLSSILLAEMIWVIDDANMQVMLSPSVVSARDVGKTLYGPYLLAVEIASFLLLAGLVSAYHFAKPEKQGGR